LKKTITTMTNHEKSLPSKNNQAKTKEPKTKKQTLIKTPKHRHTPHQILFNSNQQPSIIMAGGGGAILTKKHKKLMAARRKKKRLAAAQQQEEHHHGDDDGGRTAAVARMDHNLPNGKLASTTAAAAACNLQPRPAKRQKTSQPSSVTYVISSSSSSSSALSARKTPVVVAPAPAAAAAPAADKEDDGDIDDNIHRVVIPSTATAKEARKLRKDARRKARSTSGSTEPEMKLVFVNEHGQPIQHDDQQQQDEPTAAATSAESETRPKTLSSFRKPHPDKKPKVFPRINDILEQERKKAQIVARQDALQAADAALPVAIKNRYVALDCEMVGTGINGKISVLARVSITDWHGNVLLDTFVQVPTRVTDFRTQWSGVTPGKIQAHNNAMAVDVCRKKVAEIIKGKILVGHALKNDLDALILTHPKDDIRDTGKYRYYQRLFNKKWRPRKLRDLALEHLGLTIQNGDGKDVGHDSVDDARAAMELFKLAREAWEKELASKRQRHQRKR
jgi:RNA exonuclease 4